jgi:hypothetical protein
VTKRHASPGWLLAAIGIAAVLTYITFVGSVLNSCGAGNHGPSPGAEEEFCGFGAGEASDYSRVFILVNLIPAAPVIAGGLLPLLGRSRVFFAAGVCAGLLATWLIWTLEP